MIFTQNAFVMERKELLELHKSKWEGMMTGRADREEDYMKKRNERVERYEKDLQDLRVNDGEEYNQLKIKLETDVQVGGALVIRLAVSSPVIASTCNLISRTADTGTAAATDEGHLPAESGETRIQFPSFEEKR